MRAIQTFLVLLCGLCACQNQVKPSEALPAEVAAQAAPAPDEAPVAALDAAPASTPATEPIDDEAMYEPTFGERTTVVGFLDMARIAGGKRLQATELFPDGGGESLLLSYRPVAGWYAFVEKRVKVTGRPYTPSPYTQHVLASHFEVEEITLEDGSVPPPVASLPPATRVGKASEFPAEGRWVRLVGTLRAAPVTGDGFAGGIVKLGDGTDVSVPHIRERELGQLDGQTVSAVGQWFGAKSRSLSGRTAVCAGEVPTCGHRED